jgi:acetoin utilization protein AcuB
MTRKLVATTEEASAEEAARLMLDHTVSCLPVTDSHQRPVGIVTWRDLLQSLIPSPAKS